ncbi:MAG: DNA methyltransferase [Mariprofundales bacterium]
MNMQAHSLKRQPLFACFLLVRVILDQGFGEKNFQSEIIWSYKRWSNSKKGLLSSHQNIYFYLKSKNFKFNTIYTSYSETTNIDQILQRRTRDEHNKSIYDIDDKGVVKLGDKKKGVPLNDVWDIPYLNPKAKKVILIQTNETGLFDEHVSYVGMSIIQSRVIQIAKCLKEKDRGEFPEGISR